MRLLVSGILILFIYNSVFSQSNIPESIVNISAGVGQPHGGIGAKTIIGRNNSGLVLGLGYGYGVKGFTIGGQIARNAFYVSLNYGTIKTTQINNGPPEALNAGSCLVGGMIGLGSKKHLYIDIAVGHTFGAPNILVSGQVFSNNGYCFYLGIGYRIPAKKREIHI